MSPRRYESPNRDAAAEETRRRIVAAAGELLAGPKGFAGMSLEAVAKTAGVSRLTIYNQFGTRRGLLEAVFDDRAERGGLFAIPQAVGALQPRAAILRIVEIFCGFWASDRDGLSRVWAAGVGDPELAEGVRARSERRRGLFSTLVDRLAQQGEVDPGDAADLVDFLYALTSLPFFSEMSTRGRTPEAVAEVLKRAAQDALERARPKA